MLNANLANLRKLKCLKFDAGYEITSFGFSKFAELRFPELMELKLNYFPKVRLSVLTRFAYKGRVFFDFIVD